MQLLRRSLEAADQYSLTENVAFHSFQNFRTSGVRSKGQLRVESKKFERVVMVRILRRIARTHIADVSPSILGLDHAVGGGSGGGLTSRETSGAARDVECHPVQHILGILPDR